MENSYSVLGPHDAGPDFVTHYYADGPSFGCGYGDDAGVLDFGSDCFSAYAGPGLGCDCAFYPCFCYGSDSSSSCERE